MFWWLQQPYHPSGFHTLSGFGRQLAERFGGGSLTREIVMFFLNLFVYTM